MIRHLTIAVMAIVAGARSGVRADCVFKDTSVNKTCTALAICKDNMSDLKTKIQDWDCTKEVNYGRYHYKRYQTHYKSYKLKLQLTLEETETLYFSTDSEIAPNIRELKIIASKLTVLNIPYTYDSLTLLDISNNAIKTANFRQWSHISLAFDTLNLSNNSINEFVVAPSDQTFPLRRLDLGSNLIAIIPDDVFGGYSNLQELNLSDNVIESLSLQTFGRLTKLQKLDISNNRIKKIGHSLARQVELKTLGLAGNMLSDITAVNLVTMNRLERLNISSNYISSIDDDSFSTLVNLKSVDLSYNNISRVNSNCFRNNIELNALNISYNNIEVIEDNAFINLKLEHFDVRNNRLKGVLSKTFLNGLNARELDFSNNSLHKIGSQVFSSLTAIMYLNVSMNAICNISEDAFIFTTNMTELDLSNNNLTSLSFNTNFLQNLKSLYLQNNSIKSIHFVTFANLKSLEFLDLSHNHINQIEDNVFGNLKKLLSLNLKYNKLIDDITSNTFKGLESLPFLMFDGAKIKTIGNESFAEMTSVQNISLTNGELSRIDYNAFQNTRSLLILDLSNNLISTFNINTTQIKYLSVILLKNNLIENITNQTFRDLCALTTLNLADNIIKTIDSNSLNHFTQLKYLDISSNVQVAVDSSTFSNLNLLHLNMSNIKRPFDFKNTFNLSVSSLDATSCNIVDISSLVLNKLNALTKLSLKSNKIKFVNKLSFSQLSDLNWLDLSQNYISLIQPGSFIGTNLSRLNLSDNMITTLKYGTFDGLVDLVSLDLSNNALQRFDEKLLHANPRVDTLIMDNNEIDNIDFLHSVKVRLVSVFGNPIPCVTLVQIKQAKHLELTFSKDKTDYYSENVDGIPCISDHKNETKHVSLKHSNNVAAVENNTLFIEQIVEFGRNLTENVEQMKAIWLRELNNSTDNNLNEIEHLIESINGTISKDIAGVIDLTRNVSTQTEFNKMLILKNGKFEDIEMKEASVLFKRPYESSVISETPDYRIILYFIAICLSLMAVLTIVIAAKIFFMRKTNFNLAQPLHTF